MSTAESEDLIKDKNCMPITLSLSEIIKGKKVNWKELSNELLLYDPHLQLKDDGIEMFDGEITILANNSDETELELIWDECREQWFKVIHKAITDLISPESSPVPPAISVKA